MAMRARNGWMLLGGTCLGAGLMFMLDPNHGRRRRALVRDKAAGFLNNTGDTVRRRSRDVMNRASGVVASARSLVSRGGPVPDDVLKARVRSRIGHVVAHPGAIDIAAQDGIVTLSGPILASEVGDLIKTAAGARGVRQVINRLEVHERPGNVPELQGAV